MIAFDPLVSWPVLAVWAVLALAFAAFGYLRLTGLVRRRYAGFLALLRLLVVLLAATLLARPYRLRQSPDPDAFRTLLLADGSGSMRVRDVNGEPRLGVVSRVADGLTNTPERFGETVDLRAFAENLSHLTLPPRFLPGDTAIGDVLLEAMDDDRFADYGAVVLVSDGNWNRGVSPIDAAKRYAEAGTPVTCVGAGSLRQPRDVTIFAADETHKGRRGEPFTLRFEVSNTFEKALSVEVEVGVADGGSIRRVVELPPGPAVVPVIVEDVVYHVGVQVYRATVSPPAEDVIPETDVAYLAVDVSEPEVFRIAYLGGALDWEYKMLKEALAESDQFELSAMIQAGEGVFHRHGAPFDDEETPFPTTIDALSAFNAIVFHVGALPLMGDDGGRVLRDFVDRRGGGLLVVGAAEIPAALAGLLPVDSARLDLPPAPLRLAVADGMVFPAAGANTLHAPPGLRLPADFPVAVASALKSGGGEALSLPGGRGSVLAVQHYGSGRTAFNGFQGSWRWRLAGGESLHRHTLYWEHLLLWLASSSKPRLGVPDDGARRILGRQTTLTATVLGRDFRPVANADVSLVITAPDGSREERALLPSAEHPERFETLFLPTLAGEYGIALRAQFPDGEELAREGHFIATLGGDEMTDPGYREDVLRDIARITGGVFFRADEVERMARGIPLAERVPEKTERRYPAQTPLFVLLLLAAMCGDWFARRRIGLK